MITLFDHQVRSIHTVEESWRNNIKNVLIVLPTGAGKTLVKAELAKRHTGGVCIIFAHRDVLVGQISKALCMMEVHHTFIASKRAVNSICNMNHVQFGDSFRLETSNVIVASVDSFLSKLKQGKLERLIPLITKWMMDEAHHVQHNNKWGRCVAPLVNAVGAGFTATPCRNDGGGLGRHSGGVFNKMSIEATTGELLVSDRLSPYEIFVPPQLADFKGLKRSSTGEFIESDLINRTDRKEITGNAVDNYLKICPGQQVITFTINIEHGKHVAEAFNSRGIPSLALSSKNTVDEVEAGLTAFKEGRYLNLVNCDLFGEGFDVPSVVAVIMLRRTDSYSLFRQQFGRMLRKCEGKTHGILIDHVGNVKQHCIHGNAPHDDPVWTLDGSRKQREETDEPKGRVCPKCARFYIPKTPGVYVCNTCDHEETKKERVTAQMEFLEKDGDLVRLSFDLQSTLLKERLKIDKSMEDFKSGLRNAPRIVRNSAVNNHIKRQHAQIQLRSAIQQWCIAKNSQLPLDTVTIQMEFERKFKINILKAQTLSESKTNRLLNEILSTVDS